MKNKGLIVLVSCIAVVLIGIFAVLNLFPKYEEIDLTSGAIVSFYGYDGAGWGTVAKGEIDYDLNNEGLKKFIDNVSYEVVEGDGMKNGDEVTIKCKYSQATAENLKIKIINEEKKVNVEGLIVKYQDAKELNKNQELISLLDSKIDQRAKASYAEFDSGYMYERLEFVGAYYVVEENVDIALQDTHVLYVYNWVTIGNGKTIPKNNFYGYTCKVDSATRADNIPEIFELEMFLPETNKGVQNVADIEASYKYHLGNFTSSDYKIEKMSSTLK